MEKFRLEAEAKLVKASLIKKIHEGTPLTDLEKNYIKKWLQEISLCPDEDSLRSVMVPKNISTLTYSNLSAWDRYNLNAIPMVSIQPEHANFALNDLILELSHFIDPNSIQAVFLNMRKIHRKNR